MMANRDRELKNKFEYDAHFKQSTATVLVVAVLLPNGAIEVITNTQYVSDKVKYYIEKYDECFRLITNPMVKIVGYMLV